MLDFLNNQLLLAPMAGVNDPVFRAICRRMGARLTYTEMISSKGLAYGNLRTQEMIAALPEDRPYVVQLFGDDPAVMASEARVLEEQIAEDLAFIDINMACPARKVVSAGSGAALLQKPERAAHIVRAVCSAVSVPVTVKMRLLSDADDKTTLAFANQMVEAGVAALALHGRTAAQYYTGCARRDLVGLVARALPVPLLASGDVFSAEDVRAYQDEGAAAVLVARGARGNPWIFAGYQPSLSEIVEVAREHTVRLHAWEPRKLVWMRKHLAWYFKGAAHAVSVRKAVQTAVTLEDYLAILDALAKEEPESREGENDKQVKHKYSVSGNLASHLRVHDRAGSEHDSESGGSDGVLRRSF